MSDKRSRKNRQQSKNNSTAVVGNYTRGGHGKKKHGKKGRRGNKGGRGYDRDRYDRDRDDRGNRDKYYRNNGYNRQYSKKERKEAEKRERRKERNSKGPSITKRLGKIEGRLHKAYCRTKKACSLYPYEKTL